MIVKIFKNIIKNIQQFLVLWVVIIIANQIFIFGACFAPYCLVAALPHTGFIAAILTYLINKEDSDNNDNKYFYNNNNLESNLQVERLYDEVSPNCPVCGAKMVIRTATKGKYNGKKFWGCSEFPLCNGIINIK
jgi:hypothetical protein